MNDESEFEKLLKESLIDSDNILKEKSGVIVKNKKHKSYTEVLVSHEDLYESVKDLINEKTVTLVKGSRSTRMDIVADKLKN